MWPLVIEKLEFCYVTCPREMISQLCKVPWSSLRYLACLFFVRISFGYVYGVIIRFDIIRGLDVRVKHKTQRK